MPRWGLADVLISLVIALVVPSLVLGAVLSAGASRSSPLVLLLSLTLPWLGFGLWPILSTRLQGNGPTSTSG